MIVTGKSNGSIDNEKGEKSNTRSAHPSEYTVTALSLCGCVGKEGEVIIIGGEQRQ